MNRIKALRKEKKLKQNELARILNTNASSVCAWEKGLYKPNSEQTIKLAEYFQCSVDFLLGYSDVNLREPNGNENTITVYGRGTGKKIYKVSPKRLKAIQALLDEDDQSDDINF